MGGEAYSIMITRHVDGQDDVTADVTVDPELAVMFLRSYIAAIQDTFTRPGDPERCGGDIGWRCGP